MNRLSTGLAVVLPALILGAAGLAISNFEPAARAGLNRELANAGQVMNGRRLNRSVVDEMEADLRNNEPDVLIIGNSVANTNIKAKVLAASLGIPAKKVRVLSVPNSIGTHWYAILKNRVYANGHKPPLVVVLSPIQTMLLVQPFSESSFTNLTVQLDEKEPVVDTLVPRSSLMLRKLRQKRGAVRDASLTAARDAMVGVFFGMQMLRRENEAAMGRVFHDENIDMTLYGASMPVVDTRDNRGETGPGAVPRPEDSMLPHILQLAKENGSRMVFVRTSQAPRTPDRELDLVPEGWEEATFNLIEEAGHTYVDMYEVPLQDALYHNPQHLTEEGAKVFTRTLNRVIKDQAIFGPSSHPHFVKPPAPEVTVEGGAEPPAEVASLLDELSGRWVGPGGVLRLQFDQKPDRPRYWRVEILAEQLGAEPSAQFTVNGELVDASARKTGGETTRLRLSVDQPIPKRPWAIEIRVPQGDPGLMVQGVRVNKGPGGLQVVGLPENHLAAEYELFGELELRNGQVFIGQPQTSFAAQAPAVKRAKRKVQPSKRRRPIGFMETKDFDHLSDAKTIGFTPLAVRCSPLRVLEDGKPLPRLHEACSEMSLQPLGRVCHGPQGRVVIASSDGAAMKSGEHTYALALADDRDCAGGRWLYPGDEMTLTVPEPVLARFREGARSLTLTAVSPDDEPLTLPILVRRNGEIVGRDVLLMQGAKPVHHSVVFEPPLWPGDDVEVLFENPTDSYGLVTRGVLAAGRRPR